MALTGWCHTSSLPPRGPVLAGVYSVYTHSHTSLSCETSCHAVLPEHRRSAMNHSWNRSDETPTRGLAMMHASGRACVPAWAAGGWGGRGIRVAGRVMLVRACVRLWVSGAGACMGGCSGVCACCAGHLLASCCVGWICRLCRAVCRLARVCGCMCGCVFGCGVSLRPLADVVARGGTYPAASVLVSQMCVVHIHSAAMV